jgi:hypothetical protein
LANFWRRKKGDREWSRRFGPLEIIFVVLIAGAALYSIIAGIIGLSH